MLIRSSVASTTLFLMVVMFMVSGCDTVDDMLLVGSTEFPIEGRMIISRTNGELLCIQGAEVRHCDFLTESEHLRQLRLSNDGRRLLFVRERACEPGCVSISWYDFEDKSGRQILTKFFGCTGISWSSDGERIAFTWKEALDQQRIDHYASSYLDVFPGRRLYHPDWSPDGQTIVFNVSLGVSADSLIVIDVNSREITARRSLVLSDDTAPRWSPDGTRIVFADESHIYVLSADLSSKVYIVNGTMPVWSSDGEHIVFYRNGSLNSGIFMVDKDGSNERLVYSVTGVRYFDWK